MIKCRTQTFSQFHFDKCVRKLMYRVCFTCVWGWMRIILKFINIPLTVTTVCYRRSTKYWSSKIVIASKPRFFLCWFLSVYRFSACSILPTSSFLFIKISYSTFFCISLYTIAWGFIKKAFNRLLWYQITENISLLGSENFGLFPPILIQSWGSKLVEVFSTSVGLEFWILRILIYHEAHFSIC